MEFDRPKPSGPLYKVYENSLSLDFCEHIIERFEKDDSKYKGSVSGGYRPNVKKSFDLAIGKNNGWAEEDSVLNASLQKALTDYFGVMSEFWSFWTGIHDTGYQIQRTAPDGGYQWHNDARVEQSGATRLVTFIWYLNTVADGGHTEFWDGFRGEPKAGSLLLFPATWTFAHRGCPPKEGFKYICTGWVYGYYPH